MPASLHSDRLFNRYINKPNSIAKLISISASLPTRWNPEQEAHYRKNIACLLTAVLDIIQDEEMLNKAVTFGERFTSADVLEIKRFVVYIIFVLLPNEDWPQSVIWDSTIGRPVVYHLDTMLEFAEGLVLTLIARRLTGEA